MRRGLAVIGVALLGGYGMAYAIVETSESPTDQRIALPDGRTLAYSVDRTGRVGAAGAPGTRVILLHGAPADASSWRRVIEAAEGVDEPIEWISVDRLGYGNSSPGAEVSLAAHAASIGSFIEGAPVGTRVVLVGHSYGGPVALRAAAEFAGRVDGLVLVAGACDAEMEDAQWVRRAVNAVSAVAPRTWIGANRELLALTAENDAMRGVLGRVRCPVTIVHGAWDPVCPFDGTVAYLRGALENAAGVEVVRVERGGHNLHLSRAGEVVRGVCEVGE